MILFFVFMFVGRTISLVLHELGHAIASSLIGNKVLKISLGKESNPPIFKIGFFYMNEWFPDYGTIRVERSVDVESTFSCVLFYSGGSALNFIAFCVSFFMALETNSYLLMAFSFFNLQQCILNMRVVENYCDGGFHSDGFYVKEAIKKWRNKVRKEF